MSNIEGAPEGYSSDTRFDEVKASMGRPRSKKPSSSNSNTSWDDSHATPLTERGSTKLPDRLNNKSKIFGKPTLTCKATEGGASCKPAAVYWQAPGEYREQATPVCKKHAEILTRNAISKEPDPSHLSELTPGRPMSWRIKPKDVIREDAKIYNDNRYLVNLLESGLRSQGLEGADATWGKEPKNTPGARSTEGNINTVFSNQRLLEPDEKEPAPSKDYLPKQGLLGDAKGRRYRFTEGIRGGDASENEEILRKNSKGGKSAKKTPEVAPEDSNKFSDYSPHPRGFSNIEGNRRAPKKVALGIFKPQPGGMESYLEKQDERKARGGDGNILMPGSSRSLSFEEAADTSPKALGSGKKPKK